MLNRWKIKFVSLKLYQQVRDFLFSKKNREFLLFLFFFFISALFWLLQTLNNAYEVEFFVPVRLRNIPNNVVITENPPEKVKIKLKDKGTVLFNYMIGQDFYPIDISFSRDQNKNGRVSVLSSECFSMLRSQLRTTTTIVSVYPDTISYYYTESKAKRVPVKFNGAIIPQSQYCVSGTMISPDSVDVYAPSDILKNIHEVRTQHYFRFNVTDTVRAELSLINIKGVKIRPRSVKINVPIDIYTEKTVEVPLVGVGFPEDKVLRAFPSKVSITFRVELSRFKEFNADNFYLNVSYDELMNLSSDKYTVKLKNIPNGVSQVHIEPSKVDFLIEQVTSVNNE
ncbi:MAG: YbbR-like domain-containing protein [Bacteroidaceae bacterium]|nr:YbbR-like domain-containing protein [Bacteroidaceae bacterium]